MEVDFKKALCVLIEDGVITYEQAKSAVDKVKTFGQDDRYDTPTWHSARRLMNVLNDSIKANGRRPSRVNVTSIGVIERILRIDKRTEAEVEEMILWCQGHDFWHTVILSPEKLRKNFEQMIAQRERDNKKPKPVSTPVVPDITDWETKIQERKSESVPMPKGFKDSIRRTAK